MLIETSVDEALQGSFTERRILAHDRGGHRMQADGAVELEGRDLPLVKPPRKVPQPAFARARLVNGPALVVAEAQSHEEDRVRTPGDAPFDLDRPGSEERQPLLVAQVSGARLPFVRGHVWPLGSSG